MDTHILPLSDISLSALEHGPLREAAEAAYDKAILAVAASLPPGDTAIYADMRSPVIAEAWLDLAESGGQVTVNGKKMSFEKKTAQNLAVAMERKVRILMSQSAGKREEDGAPDGKFTLLAPAYITA